jgi:hypothetical protein
MATWRDIEVAAREDPFLWQLIHQARYVGREQALIDMVVTLSEARRKLLQQMLDDLKTRPAAALVIERP